MSFPAKGETQKVLGEFKRPLDGVRLEESFGFQLSNEVAWQSNGGAYRGHPARSLPQTLDIALPDIEGVLSHIHFVGVFALYADRDSESAGTIGATIQLLGDQEPPVFRLDLLNGQHYRDAFKTDTMSDIPGDGSSIETIGDIELREGKARVDVLTVDVPHGIDPKVLKFKDLGSPASFLLFDVVFEFSPLSGCPFRVGSPGVSLSDLGSVIRLGDRVKFAEATKKFEESVLVAQDLDEARGQALTFLAIVTAAMLEMGGSRELHRVQLEVARGLEKAKTMEEVVTICRERVEEVAKPILEPAEGPSSYLVDKALAIVERNFAKNLTDEVVAHQLGLSTSHFRYLFRQATGHPFHQYLIGLRLEKARAMLLEENMPVSQVARAVGFTGLSHFSRAFSRRFSMSPTSIKRVKSSS